MTPLLLRFGDILVLLPAVSASRVALDTRTKRYRTNQDHKGRQRSFQSGGSVGRAVVHCKRFTVLVFHIRELIRALRVVADTNTAMGRNAEASFSGAKVVADGFVTSRPFVMRRTDADVPFAHARFLITRVSAAVTVTKAFEPPGSFLTNF